MPKTCPSCNGKNIAKIFWGLPADMKSIEESLERKRLFWVDAVYHQMILNWNVMIVEIDGNNVLTQNMFMFILLSS